MKSFRRFIPQGLHVRGEHLWLVDASQPVASLYSTQKRELSGLVDWSRIGPNLAPRAGSGSATVMDGGSALWVRYGEGPLLAVIGGTSERTVYLGSFRPDRTVDGVLVCRSPAAYIDPPDEQLMELLVSADGSTQWREDSVIGGAEAAGATDFNAGNQDPWLSPKGANTWSDLPPASQWAVGWLRQERPSKGQPRPVRVHCQASTDDSLQLGTGQVISAVRDGTTIWTIIERPAQPGSVGRWLYRIDAITGDTEIALEPSAWPDISKRRWRLVERPNEAASYEQYWLSRFPAEFRSGAGSRLLDVSLIGRWPDTVIRVMVDHPNWPGIPVIGEIPLYDVVGRICGLQWAAFQLAEYVDSGMIISWPPQVDGDNAKIWGTEWAAVKF